MGDRVRVESVDALLRFRAALCKIADSMRVGLDEAEAEIQRVGYWIKNEQSKHWKSEIEKRTELLARAKSALNRKKLDKTALGSKFSYVEEEKALLAAQRRLEEAKQKYANVQRWSRILDEELFTYKAAVQGLELMAEIDLPNATASLDQMIAALEAYATAGTPGEQRSTAILTGEGTEPGGEMASMRRDIPTPAELDSAWCRALRARTPQAAVREATPITVPDIAVSETEVESPAAQEARAALAGMGPAKMPPSGEGKIVAARGAWNHSSIYLERLTDEVAGDSGWFVGFADETEMSEYEATSVCEARTRRREWSEWLELPRGFLIVFEGTSPRAVFDENDELIWSTATGC